MNERSGEQSVFFMDPSPICCIGSSDGNITEFSCFSNNNAHSFILIITFNLQSYHLCHVFQKFSLKLFWGRYGLHSSTMNSCEWHISSPNYLSRRSIPMVWSILINNELLWVIFLNQKIFIHIMFLLMEVLAYLSIFCLRFHTQWNSRWSIVIVARMMFSKDMDIVNATIMRKHVMQTKKIEEGLPFCFNCRQQEKHCLHLKRG